MRKRQLPDLPELPVLVWFRPKRRAADAIAEIHLLTSDPCNYEWVVDADIAACLDASSHCFFG
jgi:RNA-directed DNA polymerase